MKTYYKATNNLKCETLTYEVGRTYTINNIKICSHGFHFCKDMIDVLNYYTPSKDFVLLEVEPLGNVIIDGNKSVTDKIRIVRIIPTSEHKLFDLDDINNLIYYINSNGTEYWNTYDLNNNLTHYEDSSGFEYWKSYDSNNNLTHHKDSGGCEEWKTYDLNNNLIHYKDSNGTEYWNTYDLNNNLIHYKNSYGVESWSTYDLNNNLIHYKDSDEEIEWSITIE